MSPGETLMLVVPKGDLLTAEVRILPQDIDQVRVGQPAWLKFSAFNQRTTPEVEGVVSFVSADVTADPKSAFTLSKALKRQSKLGVQFCSSFRHTART